MQDGFESLVIYMVGILSVPDEEAFSLDTIHIGNVFCNNERDYDIVRPICMRNSVHAVAVQQLCISTTRSVHGYQFNLNMHASGLQYAPAKIK